MDVDLFAKLLTIRRSKTDAGEPVVPLTKVAASAFGRLRHRAEGFGSAEPLHYVFVAFVPKFKFSGKRVIDYDVTAFDPTGHLKSWRSAWRTLTKKAAGRVSGSTISGTVPSHSLRRMAHPTQLLCPLPDTKPSHAGTLRSCADGSQADSVGRVLPQAQKRRVMTQTMPQAPIL